MKLYERRLKNKLQKSISGSNMQVMTVEDLMERMKKEKDNKEWDSNGDGTWN